MLREELRNMSLNKLIELTYILEDQEKINKVIYEMVCRLYIPFKDKTFEEMLLEFGYVPTQDMKFDKTNGI